MRRMRGRTGFGRLQAALGKIEHEDHKGHEGHEVQDRRRAERDVSNCGFAAKEFLGVVGGRRSQDFVSFVPFVYFVLLFSTGVRGTMRPGPVRPLIRRVRDTISRKGRRDRGG